VVPHPRFRERLFVLEPLAEVGPDLVDPETGKTISALLAQARQASSS
jgi:2-amino-4-hydroxy-6-hydroxymethyldihydropteridine diphosphokinase